MKLLSIESLKFYQFCLQFKPRFVSNCIQTLLTLVHQAKHCAFKCIFRKLWVEVRVPKPNNCLIPRWERPHSTCNEVYHYLTMRLGNVFYTKRHNLQLMYSGLWKCALNNLEGKARYSVGMHPVLFHSLHLTDQNAEIRSWAWKRTKGHQSAVTAERIGWMERQSWNDCGFRNVKEVCFPCVSTLSKNFFV